MSAVDVCHIRKTRLDLSRTWCLLPGRPVRDSLTERRKGPRFQADLGTRGWLVTPPEATVLAEDIVSISATGVSLVLDRGLAPGVEVLLNLYHIPRRFSRTFLMRVVYTAARPAGQFLVGGTFARELQNEELQELV